MNTPLKCSGMAHVLKWFHSFDSPYLPFPSQPNLALIYRPRRDWRLSCPGPVTVLFYYFRCFSPCCTFPHGYMFLCKLLFTCSALYDSVFTALHGMQMRSSGDNSVCESVTRINCDKTVERSVQIFIPYERLFSLVFWEKEWLVGATPSTWNFGSTDPTGAKTLIFNRYSPVAPQP